MGAIDLLIDCDDLGREQQFLERLANRRGAFARSGWFRAIDEIEIVLGPAGDVNRNRGNAAKEPAADPAAIEAQRADYGDALAEPGFCVDRAGIIAETAATLTADGREVVIVGIPVSPRMAELQPDIEPLTAAALARLRDDHLADSPARVVDLSGSIRDPRLWADLTHPTQAGADAFTRALIEALE